MAFKRVIPLVVIGAVLATSLNAQVLKKDGTFFERDAEGWFWYVDPERAKEKEEEELPSPPPPTGGKVEGPPALSTAWLRDNLPKYLDLAQDFPTPENVAAYLYLQRYAMDKAQRFAEMTQMVVATDPMLDENARKPIASFASIAVSREAKANENKLLKELSKTAGILFVYHSDCSYCLVQAPVLDALSQRTGIKVTTLSLDGKPLPNGYFPEFSVDKGQAKKLGVIGTPAMFLMNPPDKVVPIAQAVLAGSEIGQRIIAVAARAGFITEEQYATTKIANGKFTMNTNMEVAGGMTDVQARDTKKLVEFMRSLYGSGGLTPIKTVDPDRIGRKKDEADAK